MSKIVFKKVICIVIAMLMLIPVLPNTFVGAEINDETEQIEINVETMLLEFVPNSITTPSAFNAEQYGKLNIKVQELNDALDGYENVVITFTNITTNKKYDATNENMIHDADLGDYIITITAGIKEFIVNAKFKQQGKYHNVINNEFTTMDPKTPTIIFEDITIKEKFIPKPSIKIEKTGTFNNEINNDFADVGETISYEFLVTNTGNVTLTNISVTDKYIPSTITGGVTVLQPEQSTTFKASYTITQEDIDNGSFYNEATVTGTPPTGKDVSHTDEDTVTLKKFIPAPQAEISLSKVGTFNDENENGFAETGETINYKFTVTNTGNVKLTNISITDEYILSSIIGGESELEIGASTVFTAVYTITEADLNNGEFYNKATVTGKVSDDKNVSATDDDKVVLIKISPAISLKKEGTFIDNNDSGYAEVGDTISYKFTVTNTGNIKLQTIIIKDPKIKGDITGNTIDLEVGKQTVLVGTYVITSEDINAERVENTATVEGYYTEVDNVTDIDTETLKLIVKKDSGGPEDPGGPKDPVDDDEEDEDDEPGVTIDEPEVPLDGGMTLEPVAPEDIPEVTPEDEIIEDQAVPLATLPDTGYTLNTTILVIIGAMMIIVGLILNKKKGTIV